MYQKNIYVTKVSSGLMEIHRYNTYPDGAIVGCTEH